MRIFGNTRGRAWSLAFLGAGSLLLAVANANAKPPYAGPHHVPPVQPAPHISYGNGELKLHVSAIELIPRINDYLNKKVTGHLIETDTKNAFVENFRTSFKAGAIVIRFDYKIKERGHTNGFFGSKIYGPWVSDSGWVEVDVKTSVVNGVLTPVTHHEYVRWNSHNWFTAQIRDLFDNHLREHLGNSVAEAVAVAMGCGKGQTLQSLFLAHGTSEASAALGLPPGQAKAWLAQNFNNLQVHADVDSAGLYAAVQLKPGIFVRNALHAPVTLAVRYMEPNGKWATTGWMNLQPGEETYLTDHGQRIQTSNNHIYFFAEAPHAKGWKWNGDHPFPHEGKNLPMREQILSVEKDGRLAFTIR